LVQPAQVAAWHKVTQTRMTLTTATLIHSFFADSKGSS